MKHPKADPSGNLAVRFRQRRAARARLPKWLGLVMPFVFLGFAFATATAVIFVVIELHHLVHPDSRLLFSGQQVTGVQALVFVSAFLIGISSSVLFTNLALWLIPPVRRILDRNAGGVPGASFASSMKSGRQALLFIALPALVLVTLAAWLP